jgi:hypothetical protein
MRITRDRDEMPASFRQLPENYKLDCDHQHVITCSHCGQKYLLVWDDKEWNYVKDWIHLAEFAVRKSHPLHTVIELPPTLKKPQSDRASLQNQHSWARELFYQIAQKRASIVRKSVT